METLEELNAQLLIVNAAIAKLYNGETLTLLELGTGESRRKYQFAEVSIENLQREKSRILKAIEALSNTEVGFRGSSRMQTAWRKC